MPVITIEAPTGIGQDTKRKMLEKVSAAVDEGYDGIVAGGAEIIVFLRETSPENVSVRTLNYTGLQSENPRFVEGLKKAQTFS